MRLRSVLFSLAVLLHACCGAATLESYAKHVASLVDPAKLATLRERGANPRVQKYVAQLAQARADGWNVTNVVLQALDNVEMKGEASKLTAETMLRNFRYADQFGCLSANGLKEMKRGNAPTIERGLYKGDQLSVDHIIPLKAVPELDHVIANLELMPQRMNASKNAKIGVRQKELARKFFAAGLLTQNGLKTILGTAAMSRNHR